MPPRLVLFDMEMSVPFLKCAFVLQQCQQYYIYTEKFINCDTLTVKKVTNRPTEIRVKEEKINATQHKHN